MEQEKQAIQQLRTEPLPIQEDEERSRYHYQQDAEFYYLQTGGDWNVYSCLYWPEEQATGTEAQTAKLDILARMMNLQPGMRILDVGCGWGGPLVYLCEKYGVTGVGITVTPSQRDAAEQRARKHGVDAQFHTVHWQNFHDEQGFDAIYSDEVIVHFHDLQGFFEHSWTLLKPKGMMVHKELHFTHERYMKLDRTGDHIYKVFGSAGTYRLLGEELLMLNNSNFEMIELFHIPLSHYRRTVDFWLANMFTHKTRMRELVGEQFYSDYRKYLKIVRWLMNTNTFSLDIVASRKIQPGDEPYSVFKD